MNKYAKFIFTLALLLWLCSGMAACGQKSTETVTTGFSEETTLPSVGDGVIPTRPQIGDTTNPTTAPTTTPATTPETVPSENPPTEETEPQLSLSITYEQYMALTAEQQQALFDRFFLSDPPAFGVWFHKIKEEYDNQIPDVIATGPVDIGDYINP